MRSVLTRAWKAIENSYRLERINSERALEAALYHELRRILDDKATILVEPDLNGDKPDLVVRDDNIIRCIIELKCTPHYYVRKASLQADIEKLLSYSAPSGSAAP